MVEIIGLVTISALVWLLAWAMGGESDSERRRTASTADRIRAGRRIRHVVSGKHAA